jgi:hypothetical protein
MGNPVIDGSQTGCLVLPLAGWRYSARPTKCVVPGRSEGRVVVNYHFTITTTGPTPRSAV